MLFRYVAKVAELERQNSNVEGELRARVNDIHSLQIMLNTSRRENSKLVNQLTIVQRDLAQQQVP